MNVRIIRENSVERRQKGPDSLNSFPLTICISVRPFGVKLSSASVALIIAIETPGSWNSVTLAQSFGNFRTGALSLTSVTVTL